MIWYIVIWSLGFAAISSVDWYVARQENARRPRCECGAPITPAQRCCVICARDRVEAKIWWNAFSWSWWYIGLVASSRPPRLGPYR